MVFICHANFDECTRADTCLIHNIKVLPGERTKHFVSDIKNDKCPHYIDQTPKEPK